MKEMKKERKFYSLTAMDTFPCTLHCFYLSFGQISINNTTRAQISSFFSIFKFKRINLSICHMGISVCRFCCSVLSLQMLLFHFSYSTLPPLAYVSLPIGLHILFKLRLISDCVCIFFSHISTECDSQHILVEHNIANSLLL